jgi:hypothetical protein
MRGEVGDAGEEEEVASRPPSSPPRHVRWQATVASELRASVSMPNQQQQHQTRPTTPTTPPSPTMADVYAAGLYKLKSVGP